MTPKRFAGRAAFCDMNHTASELQNILTQREDQLRRMTDERNAALVEIRRLRKLLNDSIDNTTKAIDLIKSYEAKTFTR